MKLYHYVARPNNVLTKGILSIAQNPDADLRYYYKRSGAKTHQEVVDWMESCFIGRSRGIRVFTEPIQWTQNSQSLKQFVENAALFEIDVDALQQDGLLEAVYVSPSVLDTPELTDNGFCDEVLQKVPNIDVIDLSPIDWSVCNDALGRRFAFVRYYLIVVKNGIISPKYLKLKQ